jgi:hypothetical protein
VPIELLSSRDKLTEEWSEEYKNVFYLYLLCRHFRNKKKAFLQAKIEELETNSKIKNVRDLYRALMTSRRGISLELL